MVFDCSCDDCTVYRFDDDWVASEQFETVLAEVKSHVSRYIVELPWLAGWTIRVEPIKDDPDGNSEWSMRINSAAYIKTAIIEVRESVLQLDRFLGDEHSIQLMVLHELCHILIEPMRYAFNNWAMDEEGLPAQAAFSFQDVEEIAVWHLARHFQAIGRETDVVVRREVADKLREIRELMQDASTKRTVTVSKNVLDEVVEMTKSWS